MVLVPFARESSIARFFNTGTEAHRSPALDLAESDLAYTVQLEMPGVAKEDVKVTVEGRRVTVQAKHEVAEEKSDAASDRIVYRERFATSYSRSFALPLEVEQAAAGARLENGVLTLTLPKRNVRAAAQVTVN